MHKTFTRQLLISGVVLLGSAAVPLQIHAATKFTYEGISYFVTDEENHIVRLSRYDKDFAGGDFVIPSTVPYEGFDYTVESIGISAFSRCDALTSVTIPESVKSIGLSAFGRCKSLTTVTTVGRGPELEGNTFTECTSLQNVGNFDYHWTNKGEADATNSIPNGTFSGCTSLTAINIPETISKIGSQAFYGCTSLTTIYVYAQTPPTLELDWMDHNPFDGCPSDAVIYVPEGALDEYKASEPWSYFSDFREMKPIVIDMQSDLVIEKGKEIAITPDVELFEAEKSTEKWTSSNPAVVTVDNKGMVTAIGVGTATLTFTVGDTAGHTTQAICQVRVIEEFDMTKLEAEGEELSDYYSSLVYRVISEEENMVALVGYENLNFGFSDYGFQGGAVTIPSTIERNDKTYSVVAIGKNVFDNWDGYCPQDKRITSITIPNSVIAISDSAFVDCYALTKIHIPNSVVYIGRMAFANCHPLKTLNIPNSVTHIGAQAFFNCDMIESIYIPASVSCIEWLPFTNCEKLTAIYVDENSQHYCSDGTILFNKDKTELIQAVNIYVTQYTVPSTVKKIWTGAFTWADCRDPRNPISLGTVIIPASVNEIEESTFMGCQALSTVKVYAEVPPVLGFAVFDYCPREVLYVPAGTKEAYQAAEGWNEFKEIREMDENSIESVENTVDGPAEYFNLRGERVSGDILPQGIYIKRHNGNSSKVYVR